MKELDMSKVVLIRCDSYDYQTVRAAVQRGLDLLGGAVSFIRTGEKILLKPNLLTGEVPDKCVTTHPAVFKAVGEILQQAGANLTYGDSPGFGSPAGAARKAGIAQAAEDLGIEMADFKNGQEIFFNEGVQNKKFEIAAGVLSADGIVSLPKLKTHALTSLTGAIKNQFGCIPGLLKGEYHVKLPQVNNFAQMLVDLNSYLKPRLFIMDGIKAMEGNGPRNGTVRQMNIILLSSDPVALDATVVRLVGLQPEGISTLKLGLASGLGTYLSNDIELLGDNFNQFIVNDFKVKAEKNNNGASIPDLLTNQLVPRPVIRQAECAKCGVCIKVCPVNPKVLSWPNGDEEKPPVYDYSRCIRCYCCQELCPEGVVEVYVPAGRRFIDWVQKAGRSNRPAN
jgi:uncharacterized protein (DUF362 family)